MLCAQICARHKVAKVWFFFQKNRKDITLEQVCSTVNLSPAFTMYEPGEGVLGLTFLICKIPAILPPQGPTWSSGGLRREHVMEASQIRAPALLQFWPVGEERRAVPESVTDAMVRHCAGCCFLGNLKPLQREGFNWLRLGAFSRAASQEEISPQEGQTPQRPESWKPPPPHLPDPPELSALQPDGGANGVEGAFSLFLLFPSYECKRRVFHQSLELRSKWKKAYRIIF